MPGHVGPPVMAHDDCLFFTQCFDQSYDVTDQMEDMVGFDWLRLIRLAVSSLIRRDSVEPCFRKCN